jgi:hypothetical protein
MARAAAERERDALKFERSTEPDDDSEPTPARPAKRNSEAAAEWQKRALAAEWQIAASVHGGEVMAAYQKAAELLNSAGSPSDYVNAFRVFHQELAKAEAQPPAAPEAPAPPPSAPVDSNRSDSPPLAEVDQKLREAAATGDLKGWLKARLSQG